jgi:hypothetical protein
VEKAMKRVWITSGRAGVTLVEGLIVIGISLLVLAAVLVFAANFFPLPRQQLERGQINEDAKNQMERMSDLLRRATNVDWNGNGKIDGMMEWWLVKGGSDEIIFYTVADGGDLEKIRWWIEGSELKQQRMPRTAGGCFALGESRILSRYLRNMSYGIQLFKYLDKGGNELPGSEIRVLVDRVRIDMVFDVMEGKDARATRIRTEVMPRKGKYEVVIVGVPECSDCLDNDNDGTVDTTGHSDYDMLPDPGCWDPGDPSETD